MLETSLGDITIGFTPDKAPEHVRNFLRLAELGVYDDMTFHRVVKGFVVQTGHLPTRKTPLSEAQQTHVHDLKAEFNDQKHVLGMVSMARLAEPDTASTSFFIVTAPASTARRQVHGVRQGRAGPRRGPGDRGGAGERRGAGAGSDAEARAAS